VRIKLYRQNYIIIRALYRQRSTGPSSGTEAGDSDLSEDDNEKIREQLSSLGYM